MDTEKRTNKTVETNGGESGVRRREAHGETRRVNPHFALSIVAVCLSCFTGFFAIPLALAALIFSLRAQDLAQTGRTEESANAAYWAGLFGWITVVIAVLPVVLFIFFGGALLAGAAAVLSAL